MCLALDSTREIGWTKKRKGHKNSSSVCLTAKMSPKQINEDLVSGQFKKLDMKNAVSSKKKKKKKKLRLWKVYPQGVKNDSEFCNHYSLSDCIYCLPVGRWAHSEQQVMGELSGETICIHSPATAVKLRSTQHSLRNTQTHRLHFK